MWKRKCGNYTKKIMIVLLERINERERERERTKHDQIYNAGRE